MTYDFSFAQSYLRDRLAGRMVDAVKIHRQVPQVFDDNTGRMTPGTDTEVYSGPARLWSASSSGGGSLGDGQTPDQRVWMVTIPYDTNGLRIDDILTVTGCASDADMVGRTAVIQEITGSGLLNGARTLRVAGLFEGGAWSP